jgi:polyphosphate kinase 2 (PPK2 family)
MKKPSKIVLSKKKVRLAKLDMSSAITSRKKYERRLLELQLLMLRTQQAYHRHGHRAVMLFEGWDAGGKGGAIKRLTEKLDPRGYAVYPIGAPDKAKQGKHYLYRFWEKLPAPGQLVVFDRSWYGRVLVERVEGFADKPTWQRAYDEINELERLLIDDGVRVLKFFMHITKSEQLKRFEERLNDPYKRWKITEDDIINHEKWNDYKTAIEAMFDRTSARAAPWHVIAGNDKKHARIRVLEIATQALAKDVDIRTPVLAPGLAKAAHERLGIEVEKKKKPRRKK